MNNATVENPVEQEAMRYLEDQAYSALLGYKEPVRSAEIISVIGKEDYSAKLIRHVLAASSRFTQIDRRWDLEIRYEDKQRPMERVLAEIIGMYGHPMTVEQIANELSSIYERHADYYETIVPRMLTDETRFFRTSDGSYGVTDWILLTNADNEDDIIFENELDEQEVERLEKAATKIDWGADEFSTQVIKFVDAMKSPVSNKYIGLFRWRAIGEAFDSIEAFEKLLKHPKLVWMSDGRWVSAGMTEQYDALLTKTADRLSEEIMEEAPQAVVQNAAASEEVAPTLSLTISDRDLDEVAQIVTSKGEARMPLILETIFELSPRDPIYPVAAEGLSDAMRLDPRFLWVGAERWRLAGSVPDYVFEVPAALDIPKLSFENMDGEQLEIELEDDGLEGGLSVEVHNPLVQDVNDQDPITEQDKMPAVESVRCVLTRHHKALGTFPLCQIPRSFFPIGPTRVKVTFISGDKKGDVWVNRETGLIYDMGDWYGAGMPESGAVFELIKTEKSDEFQFVYEEKTDPLVYVSPDRIEELEKLSEEGRANRSTFDLMLDLMSERKGVPYITLFTELNIIRRTSRRLVASILSSYYAFYQRPKTELWGVDDKKVDQGFKKAKRKYVRK